MAPIHWNRSTQIKWDRLELEVLAVAEDEPASLEGGMREICTQGLSVKGAGWIAAKTEGYSGALPLAVGAFFATLLAPRLRHWMEASYVR